MERTELRRFDTREGRRIYRLPLEVFPRLFGNAYLILGGAAPLLVDCGSGQPASNRDLERGFDEVRSRFGEAVTPADVAAVVITHGHIDHFGGLRALRRRHAGPRHAGPRHAGPHSAAPIAVHVLDRRVLGRWEERVVVASRRVERFLEATGLRAERRAQYMELYLSTKGFFRSLPPDRTFTEGEILGELEAIHVPGHCPGQVCLVVDDVLLTADHLLARISPHLSPEAITLSTGVGHYLDSLTKIERRGGIRLGLGGHQGRIDDVGGRAREIRRLLAERLERVVDFCAEPRRIVDVSREIFGRVESYHVLLAILEAGAMVEYLYQRGELVAANVEAIESGEPVIRYRRA